MQNSSIQVVGVQVVNAFTACRCLLLVVNVDLGMPFHDLSDASSQVLQQSHEVIDIIQMSIPLLNHSFLLIYSVINMLDQRSIVCRKTTCHCSTSTIEFIVMKIHRQVHGKWHGRVLCQIVCTRTEQWTITIRHYVWYERNIDESVVLGTQLPVIIDIGWIEICMTAKT